mgnify:FL=1
MRKFLTAILILSAVFPLRAQQSPYDAFAPAENLYPVLEKGCLDTIFTDTLLLVVEYEGQPYILAEFQTNPQGYVRWLTVDPLVDKYLSISPYAYCNWNPIKYVDPEGEESIIADLSGIYKEIAQRNAEYYNLYNSSVIHIFGHGFHDSFSASYGDGLSYYPLTDASGFSEYLSNDNPSNIKLYNKKTTIR